MSDSHDENSNKKTLPNPLQKPTSFELLGERFGDSVIITSVNDFFNWAKASSIWPMQFGLACCAIEMMATAATGFDMDRFGAAVFRSSPRQSDLMIVAGTVTFKMGERIKRLYEQMPAPKYVMAMGGCAINGGPYSLYGYHVVKGVDRYIPVDVYVPGCPPRPEQLLEGLIKLQELIRHKELLERESMKYDPKRNNPKTEK
jgi:NADH-quinone oxidoreductase subunit B